MGTIVENNDGGSLSVGDGVADLKRVFTLLGYENQLQIVRALGNSIDVDGSGGLETTILPKLGDAHPQFQNMLFASSYDLTKIPKSDEMWRISFTYKFNKPVNFQTGGDVTRGPDALGYQDVSARVTGKFDLCYRANPNFSNSNPKGDIGGDPVDCNGQPTSIMRPQYEIQFNTTVDETISGALATYGAEVGTVCNGNVFGLDGSTVLYKGASITRIAQNSYRLTHSFLYDQWYHTIQTPKFTTDGQISLTQDGHHITVLAVDPFPIGDAANFVPNSF